MRPEVIAAVVAAALIAGIFLLVAGLRGTTAPPSPPSRLLVAARRFWHGAGRSQAERRARQVLLLAAVAVTVVVWLVVRMPAAAIVAGLAVPGVPWLFALGRAEQRAIDRLEAIGEWVQRLNDRLTTGQGLQAAIESSVASAPQLIEPEVRQLSLDLSAGLVPAEVALHWFADALNDTVVDQVVQVLLLHLTDRGERLSAVLSALTENTARSVLTRREITAKRSEPRTTVIFMALFGLGVFVLVLLTDDLREAYNTPVGQVVMAVIIGIYVALLAWTRRLNAPKRHPRLLAPVAARAEER